MGGQWSHIRPAGGPDPAAAVTQCSAGKERKSSLPFRQPEQQPQPLRADIEHEVCDLPADKRKGVRAKIREFKDAIQPHTDEGGDPHYIGHAYQPVSQICASEWEAGVEPGPYFKYVRQIAEHIPHLEYLSLWMFVGCSPPKWRFLKDEVASRTERVTRTNVCKIDYRESEHTCTPHKNAKAVKAAIEYGAGDYDLRLWVVEDLSRDVIEALGAGYDIDPLFFSSFLGDYLFNSVEDRWHELPNLEVDARKRSHFTLSYLRPRYFANDDAYAKAERESGMFNVLRRLDSDRSRTRFKHGIRLNSKDASCALSRAKTALWIKPRASNDEPVTAILLVDPTVTHGQPLWGGYRPFSEPPSMHAWATANVKSIAKPPRTSLFDDVVFWSCRMSEHDLTLIKQDPICVAVPMLKLVIADWLNTLKYMTAMFSKLEWSFEKPHWSADPDDIDQLMKKLSPWRRNAGYYQTMINETITRLFPSIGAAYPSAPPNLVAKAPSGGGIAELWPDFKNIKHQMDEHTARIAAIQTMASNVANTEEARRAVRQNKNMTRLTVLATTFIPLSFTASFLSISSNFTQSTETIWIFFIIGIPLTLLAFVVVDVTHPDSGKSHMRRSWNRLFAHHDNGNDDVIPGPEHNNGGATFPTMRMLTSRQPTVGWPYQRAASSFRRKNQEIITTTTK